MSAIDPAAEEFAVTLTAREAEALRGVAGGRGMSPEQFLQVAISERLRLLAVDACSDLVWPPEALKGEEQ